MVLYDIGTYGGPVIRQHALALLLFVLICSAPAALAQRSVDLSATDGTKLKASYFASAKPGPGVLLLHQCNRDRKVWDGLAAQLAAAGINVLTVDNRGFGESGGTPHDKLPPQEEGQIEVQKWPGDFDVAFDYLISQPGVARGTIGVGGASCGVNNSIQTAQRHPEVKSLVLLSGPANLNDRQFLRNSASIPVFFAVADDDEFAGTVQEMEWLYSLDSSPWKKLAHYATGGHGADMFPVHPELPGMIVDWYVTTLIKTPGRAPLAGDPVILPAAVLELSLLDQPGGPAKAAHMIDETRRRNANSVLPSEAVINLVGYEHLQSGDTQGAIEIFKLNGIVYPNSPNVYDSLSDAYLADGQKDLARQNAKRAVELLSTDTTDNEQRRDLIRASAERKLKQLGDTPQ
jgi:dienelactone hydrolase